MIMSIGTANRLTNHLELDGGLSSYGHYDNMAK